jgi:hypothetical protein
VLEGQQHTPTRYPVREAKLDRGMRILWQERGALRDDGPSSGRGEAIIIWYIVKHDFISARLRDIDLCFKRMNGERDPFGADSAFKGGAVGARSGGESESVESVGIGRHVRIPEVLLDPKKNTPLLVYDVMVHQLPDLKGQWCPPMRLTAAEEAIVTTDGLVTIGTDFPLRYGLSLAGRNFRTLPSLRGPLFFVVFWEEKKKKLYRLRHLYCDTVFHC